MKEEPHWLFPDHAVSLRQQKEEEDETYDLLIWMNESMVKE